MFRTVAARKVGGHSLNGPAHDFDFFLRMSEIGLFIICRRPCITTGSTKALQPRYETRL